MHPRPRYPYRRRRHWWHRWRRWLHLRRATQAPHRERHADDAVLVLAVLCAILGVVWTLYVLVP